MALSAEPQEIPQDFLEVAERVSARLRLVGEAEALLAFAARNNLEIVDSQESVVKAEPQTADEATSHAGQHAAELVLLPTTEVDVITEIEGIILEDPAPPKDFIEVTPPELLEVLDGHTLSDIVRLSVGRVRFTEKQRAVLEAWADSAMSVSEAAEAGGLTASSAHRTLGALVDKLKFVFRAEDGPTIQSLFEQRQSLNKRPPRAKPATTPRRSPRQQRDSGQFDEPVSSAKVAERGEYDGPDSTGLYLRDIRRKGMLAGKEEERELSQTREAGVEAQNRLDNPPDDYTRAQRIADNRLVRQGRKAKLRMIEGNLPLVVSIARKYPKSTTMDLMDLVQEGNIGLEHAVDKFDWRKGFKFSTYATFWIRQAIGRALDNSATIRLPDQKASLDRRIQKYRTKGLTDDEIMGENPDITPDILDEQRLRSRVVSSLNQTIGDDDTELGHFHGTDDPGYKEVEFDDVMADFISTVEELVTTRELYILKAYSGLLTGEKMSFAAIGKEIGVTHEAARRQHVRTLRKLRLNAEYGGKMARYANLLTDADD